MSDSARTNILGRLRAASAETPAATPRDERILESKRWSAEDRIARLRQMMEAVRTEFIESDGERWPQDVLAFVAQQGARNLLYAPDTPVGRKLAAAARSGEAPELVAYDRPIEDWKAELFASIDAAITGTRCAIADTGSLVLWPSPEEPRLMSLVPPIHLALLERDRIRDTFWQVMREERWADGMPANALLVSGPSKTADIEQTLAYGVHGPKRLVVVLI